MRRSASCALLLAAVMVSGCASITSRRIEDGRISRIGLLWPVSGSVSSGFGYRSGKGRHEGVDILAPAGTTVLAAERGTVVYAGNGMRGYGNAVVLDHGDGVTTRYGHLEAVRVKLLDVVAAGVPIGSVGKTGNATTHHLHFELRLDGKAMDPMEYLER